MQQVYEDPPLALKMVIRKNESREIFQEIMNLEYWQFLSDTMSSELGLLKTICYFVIGKKVMIFREIILKTIQ